MRDLRVQPLRPRFITLVAWLTASLAISVALAFEGRAATLSWPEVKREIATRFLGVASLSPMELADWLADSARVQPLVVDVRTHKEYEVSHLPGAISAATASQQDAVMRHAVAGKPVVLYCSVGWRSAQAAQRLRQEHQAYVLNLDGGIFQWANEHRQLVRGENEPAHLVHPFNAKWGQLLDHRLWSQDNP